ncbi:hypothetical protein [Desulfovibrio litoralis]|uniref:Uncharacterized protein n=1 Tax=Desulfovibrio litoralis DSM 11393 TaxID=1121455 RepID=A0A1M7SGJ2_9BACT|nr:hypothetical protein [Desulfovibrio litoralis]SHN57593.1 hypothetical protein SAMN02745728_00924 [Desulfovibrio litoralis DSM 11393]
MRLLLIMLQVISLCLAYIIFITLTQGVSGFFAGGGGAGGPAAMAVPIFMLIQLLLSGFIIVTVILPFSMVFLGTLLCAIACGIRFLRWTRWVGVVINLLAIFYILFFMQKDEMGLNASHFVIASYFLLNIVLFFRIPRWPNIEKSRKVICFSQIFLLGIIMLPLWVLAVIAVIQKEDFDVFLAMILLTILFCPSFYCNYRVCKNLTLNGDAKRLILPVIVSAISLGLFVMTIPLFAVPILISFLLMLGLCELLVLYSGELPTEKNWRYYLVYLLGGTKSEQKENVLSFAQGVGGLVGEQLEKHKNKKKNKDS